jgi:hypothetical protein
MTAQGELPCSLSLPDLRRPAPEPNDFSGRPASVRRWFRMPRRLAHGAGYGRWSVDRLEGLPT